MLYFITHLNIAMVAIGVIGLYGSAYEPGPVPRLMVIVSGLYLLAFLTIKALHTAWQKHQRHVKTIMYMTLESEHKRGPQIFNLKEDSKWTE